MAYPRIGCEAWIVREQKVLMMKRGPRAKGPFEGTWSLPGGHLKFFERMDETLIRELQEELGLEVTPHDVQPIAITDDLRPHISQHYVHISFSVEIGAQQPQIKEPRKCSGLKWFPLDQLPKNIFPFHEKIFDTLKTKKLYASQTAHVS